MERRQPLRPERGAEHRVARARLGALPEALHDGLEVARREPQRLLDAAAQLLVRAVLGEQIARGLEPSPAALGVRGRQVIPARGEEALREARRRAVVDAI